MNYIKKIGLLLLVLSFMSIFAKPPLPQCTVTVNCTNGSISCTSNAGRCELGTTWVKCDGITYSCPTQ